jgi:hypothetical protein
MTPLFRKNISTEDLGVVLGFSLLKTDDSDIVQRILPLSPFSESSLRGEIACLRLFGSDLATYLALSHSPAMFQETRAFRDLVLDLLRSGDFYSDSDPREVASRIRVYGKVEELTARAAAVEPGVAATIARVAKVLPTGDARRRRLIEYGEAADATDGKRALHGIGACFAALCQVPNDPIVQLLGASTITAEKRFVEDFLKDFKVKPMS